MLAKEFFSNEAKKHRNSGHGATAAVIAEFVDEHVELNDSERTKFMLMLLKEGCTSRDRMKGRFIAELAEANYDLAFGVTATLNYRQTSAMLAR